MLRPAVTIPTIEAAFILSGRRRPVLFAREDAAGAREDAPESGRILLIEDDFLVATQMEAALTEAGFEVAGIAASADEALALAAAERPALGIMDIRLAGVRDGVDAALALFKDLGVRCIFATAHSDHDARTRAAAAAPLGWLQKPYSMKSLVALVRRALAELRGARE